MNELNITGTCANTSSAKGRVEWAHLSLQDRLAKKLRLRGISTPEAANAFVEEFMADYNSRFSKPPRQDFDVHRPLENNENLAATFTWREQRKVSKNLILQYDKKLYLLEDNEGNRRFHGKFIDVWQYPDGAIELRANSTSLPFITYDRLGELDQGAIVDNKRLGHALEMIKLVMDKRDNTRSQALPSLDGQTERDRLLQEVRELRAEALPLREQVARLTATGEHLAAQLQDTKAELKEAREDGRQLQTELLALARQDGKVKK